MKSYLKLIQVIVQNMAQHLINAGYPTVQSFNKQYKGKFILEVTIIKGYNDSKEAISKIKEVINKLSPDKIIIERIDDEIFKKKLGISDERFDEISKILLNN